MLFLKCCEHLWRNLELSFHYSGKQNVDHIIRVKVNLYFLAIDIIIWSKYPLSKMHQSRNIFECLLLFGFWYIWMDVMRCPGDRNPKLNTNFYTFHFHFIYIQKVILYNISSLLVLWLWPVHEARYGNFLLVTFYLHSNLWHTIVFMVQLIAQRVFRTTK